MNFTIPATKNTKAIIISIHRISSGYGMVIAFISELGKATKGDECLFFNRHGFSQHTLGQYDK